LEKSGKAERERVASGRAERMIIYVVSQTKKKSKTPRPMMVGVLYEC
jgi:hypothetical protein